MKKDKWLALKRWLTDHHHDVIRKQRVAIIDGHAIQIKDDSDILDVLDYMDELEREELKSEYEERLSKIGQK